MTSLPVPANEAPPVVTGQVVGGKFRIERVIGEGGMGIVAEATHLGLDERVALKFLRREVMKLPEVVARFDREARAAVKLKSEHVARVSDVGKTEDGIPFMVMELLSGKDLAQMLMEGGPLPITDAVEFIIQACEGVGEAHARGIVHRDIKPENLFVVERSDTWKLVKVLDFGISKAVLIGPSSVDLGSNATTSIMGSPYYMSPEQLRSTRTVDHRADIWSLGVVLFELLTGTTIFDETKDFTGLVADILEAPHRKLCMYRPDAPLALEAVLDHCLEKDRVKRFQNVAELAVALLPFAPRRSRVTAERTTSITRAAGLITDPNFQVPPSVYPPASSDSYPSGQISAPAMPQMVNPLGETVSPASETGMPPRYPTPIMSPGVGSLAAGTVETVIVPRKRTSPVVLVLGAIVLLGLGGALAYGVIKTLHPALPIAATVQPTATQVLTAQPTVTTATATATQASPTAAIDTASASAHLTTRPHATARPTATVSATATATTTRPPLDIQLTR